jgi:hypothetical protein
VHLGHAGILGDEPEAGRAGRAGRARPVGGERLVGVGALSGFLDGVQEPAPVRRVLGVGSEEDRLVVDEVGCEPLERAEANLVFQVVSKRHEKGSIILTSNKTFSEWGQVFGGDVLATAIPDRLLHHCDVISVNGPSCRLKNRLAAVERDGDAA